MPQHMHRRATWICCWGRRLAAAPAMGASGASPGNAAESQPLVGASAASGGGQHVGAASASLGQDRLGEVAGVRGRAAVSVVFPTRKISFYPKDRSLRGGVPGLLAWGFRAYLPIDPHRQRECSPLGTGQAAWLDGRLGDGRAAISRPRVSHAAAWQQVALDGRHLPGGPGECPSTPPSHGGRCGASSSGARSPRL